MATILIGGDVAPGGRTLPLFESGDADGLFGDLLPHFRAADLTVVNLECPLIEHESPIPKTGPCLGATTYCARTLAKASVHAACLANNHILDHGPEGLASTIRACEEAGIATFGAGENREAARRMLIRSMGGLRVGLIGMAEHEWSIAGRGSWGAAGLNPALFMRTVRENAGAYDFLVVLLHAGTEHYPYPTPRQMDVCRFLLEEGAGAVICQHSHRPGCVEWHEGAFIAYGQGNLLFDGQPRGQPWWHEGFLVRLSVNAGKSASAETIPYTQCRGRPGAARMGTEDERRFREALDRRSRAIQDESFVREQWLGFCAEREAAYLSLLHGHGPFLRRLHWRLPWLRWLYGRRKRNMIRNLVRCESHREVIETICR